MLRGHIVKWEMMKHYRNQARVGTDSQNQGSPGSLAAGGSQCHWWV